MFDQEAAKEAAVDALVAQKNAEVCVALPVRCERCSSAVGEPTRNASTGSSLGAHGECASRVCGRLRAMAEGCQLYERLFDDAYGGLWGWLQVEAYKKQLETARVKAQLSARQAAKPAAPPPRK